MQTHGSELKVRGGLIQQPTFAKLVPGVYGERGVHAGAARRIREPKRRRNAFICRLLHHPGPLRLCFVIFIIGIFFFFFFFFGGGGGGVGGGWGDVAALFVL